LEETVVTLAEVLDIRADTGGLVEGFIVESKMEKGRGYIIYIILFIPLYCKYILALYKTC